MLPLHALVLLDPLDGSIKDTLRGFPPLDHVWAIGGFRTSCPGGDIQPDLFLCLYENREYGLLVEPRSMDHGHKGREAIHQAVSNHKPPTKAVLSTPEA